MPNPRPADLVYRSAVSDLVDITVGKDIAKFSSVDSKVTVDLSKLPDAVRTQILCNLRRGSASAMSGPAFKVYQLLAATYDIPVFSVSRADKCLLSFNRLEVPTSHSKECEVLSNIAAMYRLANPELDPHTMRYRLGTYTHVGHRPGWVQVQIVRPAALTLEALLQMMGASSIWDLVPKDNCQRAMLAIDQGLSIKVELKLAARG